VQKCAKKLGRQIHSVNEDVIRRLAHYSWPGNVRELQNVIERAVIVCDGETFRVDASWFTRAAPISHASPSFTVGLAEHEKTMIENALRQTKGRISGPSGAATKLGLPRQTLESKINKLGINRYRFKAS